jgi:hypothetical protein
MPTTQTATVKNSQSRKPTRRFKKTGLAPLVQVDINELGDKRLDPKETVAREREDLLRIEAKKKIWGQEELEDPDRSLGPRLQWKQLIQRILLCNPQIKVKDSQFGRAIALYIRKRPDEYTEIDNIILWQPEVARLMNIPVPADSFFIHYKYLTGFNKHEMPEYSHVTVDSSHIAHREYRSWRSVLLALIKARAITYSAAIEHFGNPESDKRSGRWFEQTQRFRN